MRYIGVDLHKTSFVACFLGEADVPKIATYSLSDSGLSAFCQQLHPHDQLAVEVAQNAYYFY